MTGNRGFGLLAGAAVAAAACLAPTTAHAQDAGEPVSPTGKAITGGILLGAEVVMIPLGAAGVREWWPYVVFPPLAAAGGAVGGYFLEKSDAPAEASLYMLAGGLGLMIPALVLTLNATAYEPTEDEEEEPLPEGVSDTPQNGDLPPPSAPATPEGPSGRLAPPRGLLDLSPSRVALGLPALAVRPAYTQLEIAQFGVRQVAEYHLPVLAGSF